MAEYRSTKTVNAVRFDKSDHSISCLKEIAGDQLKITSDPRDKKGRSKIVSIYNPEFDVFIELNNGEWLVKDGESLLILTNDEFRESYEDMLEYNNWIINKYRTEYESQLGLLRNHRLYSDSTTDWDPRWTGYGNPYNSWSSSDGSYTIERIGRSGSIVTERLPVNTISGSSDAGIDFIESYSHSYGGEPEN